MLDPNRKDIEINITWLKICVGYTNRNNVVLFNINVSVVCIILT